MGGVFMINEIKECELILIFLVCVGTSDKSGAWAGQGGGCFTHTHLLTA